MRVKVRGFHSPDVDLDNFKVEDPEKFSFSLEAFVGPADSEGEESLSFRVCNPKYLATEIVQDRVILGWQLVIVNNPDLPKILDAVTHAIERTEADSWRALAGRLARIGHYEFEDFV